MKLKTLASVFLALAACSKASTAVTTPGNVSDSIRTLPVVRTETTTRHIASVQQASGNARVVGYYSAQDLHGDHRNTPEADRECKYHFTPDTLLTILFGAGGLIEPILIALFFHQVHNMIVQQPPQHGDLGGDFHRQDIPLQEMDVAAHLQRTSAVYLDPTRPDIQLEVDEYPSTRSISPPYSLTDVTLAFA